MSITSSPVTGISIHTAAKTSILSEGTAGSASALGSQSGANSDQVIVPTAITSNNEGNLEATPSYVGRHFCLRPLTRTVDGGGIGSRATIQAGGSGYTNGAQTLTVSGGTGNNSTTVNVNVVGGVVDSITGINAHGDYTTTPSNPVSTTGGGGTGCTLNITWEDGEEIRFITADATNTLTVHEDWDNVPVSGEDWGVSYIFEDVATVTACTLNTKTGVYEFTRDFHISAAAQPSGQWAFFGHAEGKAMEVADTGSTSVAGLNVRQLGVYCMGYLQDGVPINGGYLFGINNTDTERFSYFDTNARCFIYDCQVRSALADMLWFSTSLTSQGNRELNKAKIYEVANDMFLMGWTVRDLTVTCNGPNGNFIKVDDESDIDGITVISLRGFISDDDAATETLEIRNCLFVGNDRHVRVHDDKTWNFINPKGWIANSTYISFAVDDLNSCNKKSSLDLLVQETDGTGIQNARTYIYEGLLNGDLPSDNQQNTDSDGIASSDVLVEKYTYPSSVFTTTTYGDFALKIYKWDFEPTVSALTISEDGWDLQIAMVPDPAITAATAAAALTAGSGIVVDRHASGETDPRPLKVLNYDGGTGTVPTLGETITQGSANGVLVEYLGDAVSGTLVLKTWNGTEFTDNQTITGGTSSFSATTHLIGTGSFYEEYTWLVDGDGKTMAVIYDYIMAQLEKDTLVSPYDDVIIWGEAEHAKPIFSEGGAWHTKRNVANTEGWWIADRGAGSIDYFTADDGTQYVPATTVTLTLTNLVANSEVRIYTAGTTTELDGVENSGTSFEFTYNPTLVDDVDIVIHHIQYEYIRIEDFTTAAADAELPVQQRFDNNYYNPL